MEPWSASPKDLTDAIRQGWLAIGWGRSCQDEEMKKLSSKGHSGV